MAWFEIHHRFKGHSLSDYLNMKKEKIKVFKAAKEKTCTSVF